MEHFMYIFFQHSVSASLSVSLMAFYLLYKEKKINERTDLDQQITDFIASGAFASAVTATTIVSIIVALIA